MVKETAVSWIKEIFKGVVIGVLFSLVAVLVFALVVKWFSLPSSVILPVDQAIKALAVLVGCIFGVGREKGLFKGMTIGVLVVSVTYFIFAAIAKKTDLSLLFLLEMLFGCISGGLGGIIAVNIHK